MGVPLQLLRRRLLAPPIPLYRPSKDNQARQSQSAVWSTAVVMGLKVKEHDKGRKEESDFSKLAGYSWLPPCLLSVLGSPGRRIWSAGRPSHPGTTSTSRPPTSTPSCCPPTSPPSSDSQPCPTYLSLSS